MVESNSQSVLSAKQSAEGLVGTHWQIYYVIVKDLGLALATMQSICMEFRALHNANMLDESSSI